MPAQQEGEGPGRPRGRPPGKARAAHRMERREPQVVTVPVVVMEHNSRAHVQQTDLAFGLLSDCRVVHFDVLGKVQWQRGNTETPRRWVAHAVYPQDNSLSGLSRVRGLKDLQAVLLQGVSVQLEWLEMPIVIPLGVVWLEG